MTAAQPFQHVQALKAANRVKDQRFRLKREIEVLPIIESYALLADALFKAPACLRSARALDVLMWLPGTGERHAVRWMRAARVGLTLTVGQLTDRQRVDLGRCLRGLEGIVGAEALDRETAA